MEANTSIKTYQKPETKKEVEFISTSFFSSLNKLSFFIILVLHIHVYALQGSLSLHSVSGPNYENEKNEFKQNQQELKFEASLKRNFIFTFKSNSQDFDYSYLDFNNLFFDLDAHHSQSLFGLLYTIPRLDFRYQFSPDLNTQSISLKNKYEFISLRFEYALNYYQWDFNIYQKEFGDRDTLTFNQDNQIETFKISAELFPSSKNSYQLAARWINLNDPSTPNGYQLKADGKLFNPSFVSRHQLNTLGFSLRMNYYTLDLNTQGLRRKVEDLKRFHYSNSNHDFYLFQLGFEPKKIPQLNFDLQYGYSKNELNPSENAKRKREEFLALNRIFPADIMVIIGSSWLKKIVEIEAIAEVHFGLFKPSYTFEFSEKFGLTFKPEFWFVNANLRTHIEQIEDQIFSASTEETHTNINAKAILSQIILASNYKIDSHLSCGLKLKQWLPLWWKLRGIDQSNPTSKNDFSWQGYNIGLDLKWIW